MDNITNNNLGSVNQLFDNAVDNNISNKEINSPKTSIAQNSDIDKSSLDVKINESINNNLLSDEKIQLSDLEKSNINELSSSVSPQSLEHEDSGNLNIKTFNTLPDELTKLFNNFLDLTEKFNDAKTIDHKLSLKDQLYESIDMLHKAMSSPNLSNEVGEVVGELFFDLLDTVSGIDESVKELEYFNSLLKEINTSKSEPAHKLELLQNLKNFCENTSYVNKNDYNFRLEMLRNSVNAIIGNQSETEEFVKDLNLSDKDCYNFEQATNKILSSLVLDAPDSDPKLIKYSTNFLFDVFKNSNQELVNNHKKDPDFIKNEFVKQMIDIGNEADVIKICEKTDKFFNNSSSITSLDVKEALCLPTELNLVKSQHTYQSALHNLLQSLPKAIQDEFAMCNHLDEKLIDRISEHANKKTLQDVKYQLASMLCLQHNLISNNVINVGIDKFQSFAMCCKLLQKLDVEIDFNKLEKLKLHELTDNNEIQYLSNEVIKQVKDLADRYDSGNIKGASQEKEYLKTISKSADILSNGISSNRDITSIYDKDINVRSMRVFDGLLKQLSGELDVNNRGILSGDKSVKEQLGRGTNLFEKIQKGIRASLVVHSRFVNEADREDAIKIMNTLISKDKFINKTDREEIIKTLKNEMTENEKVYNQSLSKLKGLRREFVRCYDMNVDFAKQNQECVKIHDKKKAMNAEYKKMESVYNQLTWQWPHNHKLRNENARKILDLADFNNEINSLNFKIEEYKQEEQKANNENDKSLYRDTIKILNDQVATLQNEANKIFGELKDLDLSDLTTRIKEKDVKANKKELHTDISSFLEKAQPLASALIYFKDGQAKKDLEEISNLKSQRDTIRKELNKYLDLGKKAYGEGTVLQLQRAIMLATYISSKDKPAGESIARTPEGRAEIASILSEQMGLDTTDSFISALIDDTIRRYTHPNGSIDDKRLSLIDSRLNEKSTIVEYTEDSMELEDVEALESKTMTAYKNKGTQALLDFVATPGSNFTYNRRDGFTIGNVAPLLYVGATHTRDESISVINNGNGYTVQLNTSRAEQLAMTLGIKVSSAINMGVSSHANFNHISGLQLDFKNAQDLDSFLKDFMDNESKLHTDAENYKPQWISKCNVSTLGGKGIDIGIGVSSNINISLIKGRKKYETSKSEVIIELPKVNTEISGNVQYAGTTKTKGDVTISSHKCVSQLTVEGNIAPPSIVVTNNKYSGMQLNALKNIGQGMMKKFGKQLEPFVQTILDTAKQTVKGEGSQIFMGAFAQKFKELSTNDNLDMSDKVKDSFEYAFDASKADLLQEFMVNYANQDSDNKGVKITQFGAKAYLEYLALKNGVSVQSDKINPLYGNINVGVDPLDLIAPGFSQLSKMFFDKPKDPNEELGIMNDIINALKIPTAVVGTGLSVLSTVNTLLSGDQLEALSSLSATISNFIGTYSTAYQSALGNVSATIGGENVIDVSGSYRGSHVQIDGTFDLKNGVSAKSTFGSLIETDLVTGYNGKLGQYTSDTSITQTLAISQFSLENALSTLDLPQSFLEKYKNDKQFKQSLEETFAHASPTDTISINYSIKSNKLKEINDLEKQKQLDPKNFNQYNSKINDILGDRDNYDIASLSIDISNTESMNYPVDLFRNMNFGILSFEYERSLRNGQIHTFDISTLQEKITDRQNHTEISKIEANKRELKNEIINFKKGDHIVQTPGSNTCFMMSVVNALSHSDAGIQKMKDVITPLGIIVTRRNVNPNFNSLNLNDVNNRVFVPITQNTNPGSFSPLEEAMTKAYQNYTPNHVHGEMGDGLDFATKVFGLESDGGFTETNDNQGYIQNSFDTIKDKLAAGEIAILHKPDERHYVAITSARVENGRQLVTVDDSTSNTVQEVDVSQISKNGYTLQLFKIL